MRIFKNEIAGNPARLLREVEGQAISILEVVPSLLRMMLEELGDMPEGSKPTLASLRWLIPTGEALPPSLCRQWFEYYPNIPMVNAYGPTECSDDVTHYFIHEAPGKEVINMPIGRPVANMRMYILDRHLQPVPIGVEGELYVGGIGVGRGYLNDPVRTANAFISYPLTLSSPLLLGGTDAPAGQRRLYKTGDKARYITSASSAQALSEGKDHGNACADAGNIEFRGRVDFQAKIRGFRIELGEIQVALNEHDAVHEAVVTAREDNRGNKRLVAYWVPVSQADDVSITDLRRYLFDRLPDYMVPSAFVRLDAMPLTATGKINRRALPEPDMSQSLSANDFVAPQTVTHKKLAAIWATLLAVEPTKLGINHDFFELGGHSLLATQLMSRVREIFNVELPLRSLFERPTIADFADAIEDAQASQKAMVTQTTIKRVVRGGYQGKGSELG